MRGTREAQPRSGSGASPELYTGRSATWLVAGIIVLVAAALVTFLVWPGGGPVEDPPDDLAHTRGAAGDAAQPLAATAADVVEASVATREGVLVFSARMQAPVPRRYRSAVLEVTWRLSSESGSWLVAAVIEDSVVASVTAGDGGYGSSTADATMPGEVAVEGSLVTVEVEREAIDAFPESFEWFVSTRLAADRTAAEPEMVRDRAPDAPTLVQHGD